jgi:CheY-like chemotaxis protein
MSSALGVTHDAVLLVGQGDDVAVALLTAEERLDIRRADGTTECIRLIHEHVPDVIILERMLPDGDGWELLTVLRAMLPSVSETKVIALTSDTSRASVERAAAAGCDAFLGKPCDARVVLQEVRRMLAQSRRRRGHAR